jgi:hypothetical protein
MGAFQSTTWTAAAAVLVAGCGSSDLGVLGLPDAAPETDAEVPLDAGPDVADPREAAAPLGYCARLLPRPRFCDDFADRDLTNDWDQSTVLAPSVLDLDDATFTSAPVSFVVATGNVAANDSANVSLRKTVLGSVSHVQLAFSTLLATATITKGLVAIATLDVSTSHFFTLYLRDGDATAPAATLEEQVGNATTRHVLTTLPVARAWTRIVIDLDLAAGKATVSFGGRKALDAAPITPLLGTEATIRLGAVYVHGPTEPFTAGFDDVVLDF